MKSSLPDTETVDPGKELDAYVRTAADAYRDQLTAAFVDPAAAYASFRDIAGRRGLGEAAIQMRETPEAFGALREGGEEAARDAARLGSRAYHAAAAKSDPVRAAGVLDDALTDVLTDACGAAAAPRLREAWDELVQAYGAERAAAVVRRRPRDFFGQAVPTEVGARISRIAAARDVLREREGSLQPPDYQRSRPLPRSLADEQAAPASLPPGMQARLVAAADGMRTRLAGAYTQPAVAEARLHRLVDQRGLSGIELVEGDPAALGELRTDLSGGVADAADTARAALAYGRIAFQYHQARFPDQAEVLEAREALFRVSTSARDPEQAMHGVQEAIRLHGPELEAHLAQRREEGRRGPGRGGPGGGGPDLPGDVPAERGRAANGRGDDAAVDEAVQAFETVGRAREDLENARTLREERAEAERILARLDRQDRALQGAERDFRAAADKVYRDPDAAMAAWRKLVQRENGNLEAARERVAQNPAALGPLRSEPFAEWWGPAAAKLGVSDTGPAKHAAPRMLDRAVAHTRAEREATDPVQWKTPAGETLHGREKVRTAAREIVAERTTEIAAADARVRDVGGVAGSEQAAQRSFDRLSPAQQDRARAGLTWSGKAHLLSNVVGRSVRAARMARDLGEGPAPL